MSMIDKEKCKTNWIKNANTRPIVISVSSALSEKESRALVFTLNPGDKLDLGKMALIRCKTPTEGAKE